MNHAPSLNDHKQYLITIGVASAFSWIAWAMVLTQLDPYESTGTGLSLFYISLFFSLIGTFTLLGFSLRRWLSKEEIEYQHLSVSLRQGFLLSFCTLGCIAFLMVDILRWWNGLMLVAIAVLVEMFITSRS